MADKVYPDSHTGITAELLRKSRRHAVIASDSLQVTDGTTTVDPTTEISFTSGATVTDAGGGVAEVAVAGGSGGTQQVIRMIVTYKNGIFAGNMGLEGRIDTFYPDEYGNFSGNIHAAMVLPANGVVMPRLSTFGNLPSGKVLRCTPFKFNVVNSGATERLLVANGSSADTPTGATGETICTLPQLTNTVASTGSDLSVATSDDHGTNTGIKSTAGGLFFVDLWVSFSYA